MSILPDTRTPERPDPDDHDRALYLRSYLLMRTVIGFTGVLLPIVLVAGEGVLFNGSVPLGSLSAYYHTGVGALFVSGLSVIGVFLVTYMVFHYNWDNVLSIIAGVAVLIVGLFPTGGNDPLTPLQKLMGESVVTAIHFTSATVFILSLAAISFMFGYRDGVRPDRTPKQQGRGRRLHWSAAFIIIGAVVFIGLTKLSGVLAEHSLFIGETISVFAFGVSWFVKGFELPVLLGRRPAPVAVPAEAV
jgi:hypothetical protein